MKILQKKPNQIMNFQKNRKPQKIIISTALLVISQKGLSLGEREQEKVHLRFEFIWSAFSVNFNFRSGDNTENKCEPSPKTQIPTPSFLQKVKTRRSNSNHLFIYFFQHARVTRVRNQICFLSVSFFFFSG